MTNTGTVDIMGTNVPPIEPAEPGELCENCWGIGKAFGSGPTPATVRIQVEGVEKDVGWLPGDGEPPNGTFDWIQVDVSPCRYSPDGFFGGEFWSFTLVTTAVIIESDTGFPAFVGNSGSPCDTIVDNLQVGKFHLGTAEILI